MLRLVPPLLFVLLVHLAVLFDIVSLGLFGAMLFCLLTAVADYVGNKNRRRVFTWVLLSGLVAIALLATLRGWSELTWILTLPPVLINAGIFFLFARTLLPGQEPLITRFRRLDESDLTPESRLYTKRLTIFWVIFLGITTSASVLAALYMDWKTWSWVVNIACPASAAALFLTEHFYRKRYLTHFGPTSLVRTFRAMLHPEAWSNPAVDRS